MHGEAFLKFMEHFKDYVNPTQEKPVLLLLDNHATHVHIDVISFAKQNHIVLLSYPPHCSHKLQPLDVSVFGPLKKY